MTITEPVETPSGWFYLSFADATFLGACIVQANDFLMAVRVAHMLGINPGGEVRGHEIPEGAVYDPKYRNRLLSRIDLQEMLPGEVIMTEREKKGRENAN